MAYLWHTTFGCFMPSSVSWTTQAVKTTEGRKGAVWSDLCTNRPFSSSLPCFLYWRAKNSCLVLLWCPIQLFHIHPVALSICWQEGRLTWKRIVAFGGFCLKQAWPFCLSLEQNECSSQLSLTTAAGYVLVERATSEAFLHLSSENWGVLFGVSLDKACVLRNVCKVVGT